MSITNEKIKEYWVPILIDMGLVHADIEKDFCFACNYTHPFHPFQKTYLERCHILAKRESGEDVLENLHLLCPTCHKESEYYYGDMYWAWMKSKMKEKREDIRHSESKLLFELIVKKFNESQLDIDEFIKLTILP